MPEGPLLELPREVVFVKVGLAGWAGRDWRGRLAGVTTAL